MIERIAEYLLGAKVAERMYGRHTGTRMRKLRRAGRKGGPYFVVRNVDEVYAEQIAWHVRRRVRLSPSLMAKAERLGVEVPARLRPKPFDRTAWNAKIEARWAVKQ